MTRKKWDKETVMKDASAYQTVAEWRKNSPSAYAVCCRNKWNEAACSHMTTLKLTNGYWTKERLLNEATKYKTTAEWSKASPSSYAIAKRKKLVPATMLRELVHGKWTKANIVEVAQECKTRGEFKNTYPSAYTIAAEKGWLDHVCRHMLSKAPWFGPRVIREYLLMHDVVHLQEYKFKKYPEVARYPFDFYLPDFNLVIEYHGRQHKDGWLRNSENAREIQTRDKIKKDFALANQINYLELNALTKTSLVKQLDEFLSDLSKKNQITFSIQTRDLDIDEQKSLDTAFIWNKDSVMEAAAKCRTIKEFREGYQSAYDYALKNGIWTQISGSLKRVTDHRKYSKDYVLSVAMGCKTRNEFKQKHRGAWAAAQRNGWLLEVCSHMPKHTQKPWLV